MSMKAPNTEEELLHTRWQRMPYKKMTWFLILSILGNGLHCCLNPSPLYSELPILWTELYSEVLVGHEQVHCIGRLTVLGKGNMNMTWNLMLSRTRMKMFWYLTLDAWYLILDWYGHDLILDTWKKSISLTWCLIPDTWYYKGKAWAWLDGWYSVLDIVKKKHEHVLMVDTWHLML